MGPRATVDFYDKLVRATPAATDQDHLRVVLWADPTVPSRQAALLSGGTDPTPWLEEGLRHLVDAGAELVVVPCNTVHAWVTPLAQRLPVDFLSIIDVTTAAVRRAGAAAVVGVLATDGALAAGVFQDALDRAGIPWVLPDAAGQRALMDTVEEVKAGRLGPVATDALARILSDLRRAGATVVIAGCTELSALADGLHPDARAALVDPSLELARATVAWAGVPRATRRAVFRC